MKNSPVKENSEKGEKKQRERKKEEREERGEKERFKELGFFCLEKTKLIGQFIQVRCLVRCVASSETVFMLNG